MRVNTQRLTRVNLITRTTFLPTCGHPAHLNKHAHEVLLLPLYAGDTAETATARLTSSGLRTDEEGAEQEGSASGCGGCVGLAGKQHVVAVAAVDPRSRSCWEVTSRGPRKADGGNNGLDEAMECCTALSMPLVAVPVFEQEMLSVMQSVMQQAEQAVRNKVQLNLEKSHQLNDADQNLADKVAAPAPELLVASLGTTEGGAVALPWLTKGNY